MKTVKFIKSFRVNENEVKALFFHNKKNIEFIVTWNNIHPSTGDTMEEYDIMIDCMSNNCSLNEEIENEISKGDWGGIYYDLCEQFGSNDCKDTE